jgi:mRNA interferase MazF
MMQQYIPQRSDIIWLDFEPVKGKEIGKYRPAFVLSSKEYNKKTGLLICCSISTRISGVLTEVEVYNLEKKAEQVRFKIETLYLCYSTSF